MTLFVIEISMMQFMSCGKDSEDSALKMQCGRTQLAICISRGDADTMLWSGSQDELTLDIGGD